ncbi:hypothetical protein EXE58_16125 [Nocardioides seonyuensis]|uniref:Putative zinc-finger domain-containing protein n=1 Tax=Nocardioides seonyuensis TaxID=2518371 RepID=A0A4P7IKF1_9ACTN|nr:zf-HC2 domain-containing protein [Nocardioides seonyuensis]QBX56827.1 hypothetical protein EXE58_16125 [Nocardioides seonyuensis]
MTHTWHAEEPTLRSWVDGSAEPVLAASLEAHLLTCAECRRRTAALSPPTPASDAVRRWESLADVIDQPRRSRLTRLGLATPAQRGAWLAALALLLALPAAVALLGGRLPLLLALAPLAPMAAVAAAYGRSIEPAGEMALAAPVAGLRIVALRSLAVALPAVPLGIGGALVVGLPLDAALAWLLPGAALAALVLAAGTTRVDPATVAAGLGSVWALAVSIPPAARRVPAQTVVDLVASTPFQATALAVAMLAVAVTIARRDHVAYRRTA